MAGGSQQLEESLANLGAKIGSRDAPSSSGAVMYRLICFVAICASAFVAGPQKALHSACTSSNTPSTRTCRRAKDDDDAVEDLIRRARALREDAAQTEAALVEETVLEDESAANYADELGLADAVLEERRKEARRLAAEMLNKKPEDKSKWPKFSGNKEAPEEAPSIIFFGPLRGRVAGRCAR